MPAPWTVFETALESTKDYQNPFWDIDVTVSFTGPSGEPVHVDTFWDGARTWRVRFSPDTVGTWQWASECSDESNAGLHGQTGSFECTAPITDDPNPLYRHGPVKLSGNRRYFVHEDGTPFFWLSDTAWNGALCADPTDWEKYLTIRKAQRFTTIQFVSTHWRGSTTDRLGETAWEGDDRIVLNPAFFQRLDPKIAAINAHGLIAAPVMLWTLTEEDPGQVLSEAACIRVARYQVARWGAYQVIWILGGDGQYYEEGMPERWRRVGRAAFPEPRRRLSTLHPCGISWVAEEFAGEPWFDFLGYQSGHGDSEDDLCWLTHGPPASEWPKLDCPVVNLEPNYEMHPAYQSKSWFIDYEVRRAVYWSLLVSPTAGVTYGCNPIWVWRETFGPAEGHRSLTQVLPWRYGLNLPGIEDMTHMRTFFDSLPWWDLRPAPDLIDSQSGNPAQFIAAAQTKDKQFTVVYLPCGGEIELDVTGKAEWFDPRTGQWNPAKGLHAPDNRDWLLKVTSSNI